MFLWSGVQFLEMSAMEPTPAMLRLEKTTAVMTTNLLLGSRSW